MKPTRHSGGRDAAHRRHRSGSVQPSEASPPGTRCTSSGYFPSNRARPALSGWLWSAWHLACVHWGGNPCLLKDCSTSPCCGPPLYLAEQRRDFSLSGKAPLRWGWSRPSLQPAQKNQHLRGETPQRWTHSTCTLRRREPGWGRRAFVLSFCG